MHARSLPLGSALLLAALACRDDAPSPTEPADPAATELAAVSNAWITRRDMWSNQISRFATAMIPTAGGQSILYVIGGATATDRSLSKVMAYDVAANRWAARESLPLPLRGTNGAGVIGGKIYVSGGRAGYRHYPGQLFVYDPAADSWARKRDLPIDGFDGMSGVIDGQLYVVTSCYDAEDCTYFGEYGLPPGHPDRWLFRYNPLTDTWTELAIPPRVLLPEGGTIGGKLYVANALSSTLLVYDPATDAWSERVTGRAIRRGAAFATLGAKLYMIGGLRQNADGTTSPTRATTVYDPSTNQWTNRAQLPTARSGMVGARVLVSGRGRIEVLGGTRPGNNLQYIP